MKTTIVTFLLFTLVACSQTSRVANDVFGDQQRLDAFLATQQVTAQRLHRRDPSRNFYRLDNYDKDSPVRVAPAQVREIQQLLQRPSSYPWEYMNACLPKYGVLLTFRNDQHSVQIALCFECNMLGVYDGDSTDRVNRKEDFDPIRPQLVAVAKAIFPADPEIQALK